MLLPFYLLLSVKLKRKTRCAYGWMDLLLFCCVVVNCYVSELLGMMS